MELSLSTYVIAAGLIFVVSFLFAMLGLGGGMLYLPIFTWLELPLKTVAIPVSLLLNGLNTLLAFVHYARAGLIDIRFPEEHAAWQIGLGQHIPLNELPDRLGELDPDKTIVTMCPHYDRAEIARLYLTLRGYRARYLTDGMLGIANHLRGDTARDYMNLIQH